MADGGFLNPELEKDLLGDIEGVSNVQVWREFVPMRDTVEYTLFFRSNDVKHRTDFEVKASDIAFMQAQEAEDFVMRKARAAIMKEIDNG